MVSKYFELKMESAEFHKRTEELLSSLENKKVIIYGAGSGFLFLEKQFKLSERLNIVGIADKKFKGNPDEKYYNLQTLSAEQIKKESYDYILVDNEAHLKILNFLVHELSLDENKIKSVFGECIEDEIENVNYLYKIGFDKTLLKLIKKLKNKRVIFYGAGIFLETIQKYFDISGINVIGISDKKFEQNSSEDLFLGYKTIPPEKITELNPDYIVVTTKFYVKLINILENGLLKNSGIKIIPLAEKPFNYLYEEFKAQ